MNSKSKKTISKPFILVSMILILVAITGCGAKSESAEAISTSVTETTEKAEASASPVVVSSEVSENSVVSENIVEDKGPVFTKNLTQEEKDKYFYELWDVILDNPPVDGIYNPEYDFTKSDSIYKNDKNFQREVLKERTAATTGAAVYKSKEEGRDYIGIDCKKGFPISSATDSLSIITLNDNLGEYYIIKDYKGEDIISKDSYLDFCTGNKLEKRYN